MSAQHDRSYPVKFHFGNALENFADKLPSEDEVEFTQRQNNSSIEQLLDRNLRLLDKIQRTQNELYFYIKDIKRCLGG